MGYCATDHMDIGKQTHLLRKQTNGKNLLSVKLLFGLKRCGALLHRVGHANSHLCPKCVDSDRWLCNVQSLQQQKQQCARGNRVYWPEHGARKKVSGGRGYSSGG